MSQVVTLRLPDETAVRLRELARRTGRTVNDVGSTSIEEWMRQQEFAEIEFRSFSGLMGGERHACVKGHMAVWRVIELGLVYEMNAEKVAEHLEWPVRLVNAAFNYYAAYPEEIDRCVEENRSMGFAALKRVLPNIRLIEVDTADLPNTSEP